MIVLDNAICYYAYVTMHVKESYLFVARREHCVLVAGFCLHRTETFMSSKNQINSLSLTQMYNVYCICRFDGRSTRLE